MCVGVVGGGDAPALPLARGAAEPVWKSAKPGGDWCLTAPPRQERAPCGQGMEGDSALTNRRVNLTGLELSRSHVCVTRSHVEQKSRLRDPVEVHFHSHTGGGAGTRRSRGLAHFHPAGQMPSAHGTPCAASIAHGKERRHSTRKKGRRAKAAETALGRRARAAGRPSRTRAAFQPCSLGRPPLPKGAGLPLPQLPSVSHQNSSRP